MLGAIGQGCSRSDEWHIDGSRHTYRWLDLADIDAGMIEECCECRELSADIELESRGLVALVSRRL